LVLRVMEGLLKLLCLVHVRNWTIRLPFGPAATGVDELARAASSTSQHNGRFGHRDPEELGMTNIADGGGVDLGPAAVGLAQLVTGVPDELLDAPTPCPSYSVGDLIDHVGGLAVAFHRRGEEDDGGKRFAGAMR
jgi:hypothetical protein